MTTIASVTTRALPAALRAPARPLVVVQHLSATRVSMSRRPALDMRLVQALINWRSAEQLRVGADRVDVSGFQHHDAIGDFQRIESMRDDESRAATHEFAEREVDLRFA